MPHANRNEVYKRQLSMALRLGQPAKQVFRLCNANQQITGKTTWRDDLAKATALMTEENGDFDQALEHLKRAEAHADACSKYCPSQLAKLFICVVESLRGNPAEALKQINTVIQQDPQEIMAYYYRIGVLFNIAAGESDPRELLSILECAQNDRSRFFRMLSEISDADGRLYHIRAFRILRAIDPEGTQDRMRSLNETFFNEQIVNRRDEKSDQPIAEYYSPEQIDTLWNQIETWMGGIDGMTSASINLCNTVATASELASEADNVFYRSALRMHLKEMFATASELASEADNVFYRSAFRIFRALADIDFATFFQIQSDPISTEQRLLTAAAWLVQLEDNLPKELVELETHAREALERAAPRKIFLTYSQGN